MYLKHECSVIEGSESYLPPLPTSANCRQRLFRWFKKTTLVSINNPLCRDYFRSNAAVLLERKRHINENYTYIIHPFSMFRKYWEFLMTIVLLATLIITPFYGAFMLHETHIIVYSIICVINCLFLMDIILTFLTGYGIDSIRKVVLEPKKIAKKYICSYFLLDLTASLPFELFLLWKEDDPLNSSSYYLACIVTHFRVFRFHTFMIYLSRVADAWQVNIITYSAIRICIIFLLIVHWTACVHYLVPYLVAAFNGTNLHPSSWIRTNDIDDPDMKIKNYLMSLLRVCCLLLSITDVEEPYTIEDNILSILTVLIGAIMGALILVLEIFSSVLSAETKYQEIINQVEEYMGYKQLPSSMQKRLISYYEYKFQKTYFREGAITANLSDSLVREINVYCYRRLVNSVSILKDMPQHIVVDIVNSLKAEIFLPNDIIVKAGTVGDCMYFLASGTVCVLTPTGKEVCHLSDGAYFGEIALIMKDQKRIASVIAIEISEVYRLDRKSFKTCFVNNVELYKQIEKVAQERREKTMILEELHKKYLLALDLPNLLGLE